MKTIRNLNSLATSAIYKFARRVDNKNVTSILSAPYTFFNSQSYPHIIKIHLNNSCNLDCTYCYLHDKKIKKEELERKVLLEFLNSLKGYRNIDLSFLGGEPFLYPGFFDILKYAKEVAGAKTITIYTNSLMIKEADAGLIKKYADLIIINMVSLNESVQDKKLLKQQLSKIESLKVRGIKTRPMLLINSKTMATIRQKTRFLESKNIKPFFIKHIPQSKNDPLEIKNKTEWARLKKYLRRGPMKEYYDLISFEATLHRRICIGGYKMISISPDGTVTVCPFIKNVTIGNINSDSFDKIVSQVGTSEDVQRFLSLPEECENCSIKNSCGGGCKAGRQDPHRKDTLCSGPYRKEEIKDCVEDYFPVWR